MSPRETLRRKSPGALAIEGATNAGDRHEATTGPVKESDWTALICRRFCGFFKEGRQDSLCGGYQFLRDNLTAGEAGTLLRAFCEEGTMPEPSYARDAELRVLVCTRCDFLLDGCDFRESRSGPPCGGYVAMEKLLV